MIIFVKIMNNSVLKILLFTLLIVVQATVFGQITKVRGTVLDKSTNEPIPFANINFANTNIGCITDFDGNFSLETHKKVDSLVISYLGYKTVKEKIRQGSYQELKIFLEPDKITLDEVVVVPGENPAWRIIRNIIKNKAKNNPDNLEAYQYEVYNKIQIDINNISDKYKKKKVFKKFQFIFDYVDTSAITGTAYLPVFISETVSDFYYKKKPKVEKEIVKASKLSGIENESINQFTGSMYQKTNIYNNNIDVLGKTFISPFHPLWKVYYKFYLVDSAFKYNHWSYQISFKPRIKSDPTFSGDFWVADTSWAIEEVNIKITKDANINLVRNMVVKQKYKEAIPGVWLLQSDKMVVDFNISKQTIGFFGRKTTIYDKFVINKPKSPDFYKTDQMKNVIVLDSASEKSEEFWNKARKEQLSKQEQGIYNMVDSIKNVPLFRTYVDVITTIFTGYYALGKSKKIEIGPYSKLYSYNTVEGHRFRLGFRTTPEFSKNLFFETYLAYGVQDLTYKFGVETKYFLNKDKSKYVGFDVGKDVEQLGASEHAYPNDNIFRFVLKRTNTDRLNMNEHLKLFFGYEWFNGFSNELVFNHTILSPLGGYRIQINKPDVYFLDQIFTSEITLKTRFAYDEKFINTKRKRISLGTKYPILNIYYTVGLKDVFKSDYSYSKINASISDKIKLSFIGHSTLYFEGGQVFGTLPFPLLEIQKGNETYWYDDYSFNLMNYYEFITDKYFLAMITHRFDGLFLNKIPLLNKLKWREVIMFKGVVGDISDANKEYSAFPEITHPLTKPYMEASAGIENIFELLRIDAVWRLSYLNNSGIDKFGIRIKFQFQF